MTTLQEKRHRLTINNIAHATEQRDACLGRLLKLETRLRELHRLSARQAKALARPKPAPAPTPAPAPQTQPAATVEADAAIPAFLDRRQIGEQKDAEARARIEAEQAEHKAAKAKVRIEKLKVAQEKKQARLTGKTKQMPLTGRAALEFLRNG